MRLVELDVIPAQVDRLELDDDDGGGGGGGCRQCAGHRNKL